MSRLLFTQQANGTLSDRGVLFID